jgi:hypothetical protein
MKKYLLVFSVFLFLPVYVLSQKLNYRIIVNEVMANPKGSSGTGFPEDRNEFVELYNISNEFVNIKDWRLSDFDATDNIIAWTDSTILINYPNVIINETLIPSNYYALILDPEYTSPNAGGGEIQPYNFPDGLIILTVGNTTIGDELATNDPILIYSLQGDSSSFGTPFQEDGFPPIDYGSTNDGLSWERISFWAEDTIGNWFRSIDSSGSTSGKENSISSYYDLSVDTISMIPLSITPNGQTTVSIKISNIGYLTAYYWNFLVFDDKNRNNTEDVNERLYFQYGFPFYHNEDTIISFDWDSVTVGEHKIWAVINFTQDRNLSNNQLSKTIIVSQIDTTNHSPISIKNVFSPDNDGVDDSLSIQYSFTESKGRLTVTIYDMIGKVIRKLIDEKINDKSGIIFWDGKNEKNQIAPIAIYIIFLQYKTNKSVITEKTSTVLAKKL